jgi:hypothetical protein
MSGGTAGGGRRGGLAAVDELPSALPIEAFRTNSPSGAVANMVGSGGLKAAPGTQFFCAGYKQHYYTADGTALIQGREMREMQRDSAAAAPDQGLGNWIYCVPEYFPKACTITRIGTKITAVGAPHADNKFRLGISDDAGIGTLFPNNLQVDSGDIIIADDGGDTVGMRVHDCEVSVRAGSLMWFLMTAHGQVCTSGASCYAIKETCCYPLLGATFNTTDGNAWEYEGGTTDFGGWGIGWRIPRTYGALPNVMPTTGATRLNINESAGNVSRIPAILYTVSGLR